MDGRHTNAKSSRRQGSPRRKARSVSSHLIYPFTARVVGAPRMISQPVSSMFPSSPLPSRTWRTPGLSVPRCCLPISSLCLPCLPCLAFNPLLLLILSCQVLQPAKARPLEAFDPTLPFALSLPCHTVYPVPPFNAVLPPTLSCHDLKQA